VAATIHHTFSAYCTARRTRATRTAVGALRRFSTRRADRWPQGQTVSRKRIKAASLYKTAQDDGTSSCGSTTLDSALAIREVAKALQNFCWSITAPENRLLICSIFLAEFLLPASSPTHRRGFHGQYSRPDHQSLIPGRWKQRDTGRDQS